MRLNLKAAKVLVAAMLLMGVFAAAAYAAVSQQVVALQVGEDMGNGFTGTYGSEITLAPNVISDKAVLPGDKFHFQILASDVSTGGVVTPNTWVEFLDFEDIQVEDTNTVPPLTYRLGMDDKLILSNGDAFTPVFPYQVRAEYKPAGSSTAPKSYSETEVVSLIKNDRTAVKLQRTSKIRLAGTRFSFQVSPISGEGVIRVAVRKQGVKTRYYNVRTDEDGSASAKIRLGSKKGLYRVNAKFVGNTFGVASPWSASKRLAAVR